MEARDSVGINSLVKKLYIKTFLFSIVKQNKIFHIYCTVDLFIIKFKKTFVVIF